jgi:O-antigen/teichoic acid export membrane protein
LIIPIAALCFVLASDIITLLYSDRYGSASIYFRIYLIALLVRVGSYGILFQALNRTKYILYNAIFTLALNLGLNLILVNTPLKMKGPAIATVIVTYASMALYLFWIKSKLKFQLSKMIPWMQIARTLASALLAGVISYLSILLVESIWLNLIIGGSTFIVSYLTSAYLLGAILPYDIASMKTYIQGLVQRTR